MKWHVERSFGRQVWSKCILALLGSALFLFSSLGYAGPVIIFTGTFDPFHRNHLEQLESALEAIPGSTAEVHAIEIAPHSAIAKKSGTALPSLLSYQLRVDVIKAATSFDPRISVKHDFRVITAKADDDTVLGMSEITEKLQKSPDYRGKEIYHLVGTDIISLWLKSGELNFWPKNVHFVVGSNPELKEEFLRIQALLKNDKRFVFFDKQRDPVRSTQIRGEFLNGVIDWKQYLPKAAANYLASLPNSKDPRADFLSRQYEFLIQYTEQEVLPRLPESERKAWPQEQSEKLKMAQALYLRAKEFDPKIQRIFERARRAYTNISFIEGLLIRPAASCSISLTL